LRRALLALAACVLATPAALAAQGWSVEATAGRASYSALAARVGSTTASLSLGYEGPRRWLYGSAGTPLGDEGPSWAATGAGGFVGVSARRGLSLGASVAGHAYGYVEAGLPSGGGGTLELLPTALLQRGPMRVHLSSGFVGVADGTEGVYTSGRTFIDTNGGVALAVAPGVEVSAGARYLSGEGQSLPYAGGTAQIERGWGGAWAYAGAWLDADYPSPATSAGVGASLRVDGRTRLAASYRQEPVDPLYRSLPRRSWSVSVRRAIGPHPARAARPIAPPRVDGDMVTFRLPRASADSVPPVLLGDFNGWRAQPMVAQGEFWEVTLRVSRGVYHYGFRRADGIFIVPAGLPQASDGMGGTSAILVVG
jgi:hypothetical protein